jgi:hypothetical protein
VGRKTLKGNGKSGGKRRDDQVTVSLGDFMPEFETMVERLMEGKRETRDGKSKRAKSKVVRWALYWYNQNTPYGVDSMGYPRPAPATDTQRANQDQSHISKKIAP